MTRFFQCLFFSAISFQLTAQTKPTPDHVLYYDKPAAKWLEALPLGNGTLGAMVYGQPEKEHIQLNENSLVTGTPDLVGNYQSLGDLYIETGHQQVRDYHRKLDLSKAIHRVSYIHDNIRYTREAFISYPHQAMIVMFTSSSPHAVSMGIRLYDDRKMPVSISNNQLLFQGQLKENGMEYACGVEVVTRGGKVNGDTAMISVSKADTVWMIVKATTSFNRFAGRDVKRPLPLTEMQNALKSLRKQPYAVLLKNHLNDYVPLYSRVELVLGENKRQTTDQRIVAMGNGSEDPALEALMFQYGRYLLISSSRKGGLPANLQGLWNNMNKPPWYSQYTTNINIEMNYWLAEVTNLPEVHYPLFDWVMNMQKVQKSTQDTVIKTNKGWVSYSTNNIMGGGSGWRIHRVGSAWLSKHFWDHFQFTQDTAFLRDKAYPLIRDIVEYWEEHLISRPDGKLITPDGWSPEHGPGKNEGDKKSYPGVSYDQQIIHDLFGNFIAAASILKVDQDYAKRISDMRTKLLGPQIGRWGQLQEWQDDLDDSTDRHRHLSHLFAVYPGEQIDIHKTPEWAKAAAVSLKARGDDASGWSSAWRISLWARLLDAQRAHYALHSLLFPVIRDGSKKEVSGVYPNLFTAYPPFQLDANFGFTAGVAEMLLQSQGGEIHLLPALPEAWKDGNIKGLKARGNLIVDLVWKDHALQQVCFQASNTGYYTIRYANRRVNLLLQKGKRYLLNAQLSISK
jgi:alpha-L-fucosidase 2